MSIAISISNSVRGSLVPGGGVTPFLNEYSMTFDGIDERFYVGTSSLGITNAISVSAWVKIPTTNTGGGGTNIQVIACEDNTVPGQRNWNLYWRGTGYNHFSWVIWDTNNFATSIFSTGITPNDGQWHHLLATYDGTNNTNGMKLYIDGVLNVQGTAASTGINSYTSTETTIGVLTGGNSWRFEGNIDEVAIWDSDQNTNASTIYNGGAPNDLTSLSPLSWWRMGDGDTWNGSTWTLTDNGSGGNDATSVNMEEGDRVTDVPGGVDADAQAFITAASITDSTEQSAINQLVVDLKGYSIWTKMKAIYPFVGGTASTHKYNLKDSQDTDAAFRLVFNGGWTHSSNGALPNGTNGWAETFVKTGTDLALNSTHVSVYLRTDTAAADRLAIGNCFGGANFELSLWIKGVGNYNYHRNNTNVSSITSNSDSRGLFIGNRNSSTQQKIVKNTTINTFSVNSVSTTNTRTINISSALNAYNTARAFYDNKELAFSSIGDGLTDTDLANFYTAVQAFQTTLSRNV